jgi:hypothetical protein
MPHIETLPVELQVQILGSVDTIDDMIALSSTCHRLHSVYASQRVRLAMRVAERQHGPLEDAVQLLTYKAGDAPLADRTAVAPSLALVGKIHKYGVVANCWADIYPLQKWRERYLDRRALTEAERQRVRAAIYRLWLFTNTYHDPEVPAPYVVDAAGRNKRRAFMRHWPTAELVDMFDMRFIMQEAVEQDVCPSNAEILRRFLDRHEGDASAEAHAPIFNVAMLSEDWFRDGHVCPTASPELRLERWDHGDWVGLMPRQPRAPRDGADGGAFNNSPAFMAHLRRHEQWIAPFGRRACLEVGRDGWGDGVDHSQAVNRVMKLGPGFILYLQERQMRRVEVLEGLRQMGPDGWFERCGDTCGDALMDVIVERGLGQDVALNGGIVAKV